MQQCATIIVCSICIWNYIFVVNVACSMCNCIHTQEYSLNKRKLFVLCVCASSSSVRMIISFYSRDRKLFLRRRNAHTHTFEGLKLRPIMTLIIKHAKIVYFNIIFCCSPLIFRIEHGINEKKLQTELINRMNMTVVRTFIKPHITSARLSSTSMVDIMIEIQCIFVDTYFVRAVSLHRSSFSAFYLSISFLFKKCSRENTTKKTTSK